MDVFLVCIVYVCVPHDWPTLARRWWWIPWDWSYRRLWAAGVYWESSPGVLKELGLLKVSAAVPSLQCQEEHCKSCLGLQIEEEEEEEEDRKGEEAEAANCFSAPPLFPLLWLQIHSFQVFCWDKQNFLKRKPSLQQEIFSGHGEENPLKSLILLKWDP